MFYFWYSPFPDSLSVSENEILRCEISLRMANLVIHSRYFSIFSWIFLRMMVRVTFLLLIKKWNEVVTFTYYLNLTLRKNLKASLTFSSTEAAVLGFTWSNKTLFEAISYEVLPCVSLNTRRYNAQQRQKQSYCLQLWILTENI